MYFWICACSWFELTNPIQSIHWLSYPWPRLPMLSAGLNIPIHHFILVMTGRAGLASTIKTHHNDTTLVRKLRDEGRVIEPLKVKQVYILCNVHLIISTRKTPREILQGWGSGDFWPSGPVLFSLDPDPDPTCNNGFIKLFSSWTKYNPELTNSSLKWWFKRSTFMPSYLNYKYIFFFISI